MGNLFKILLFGGLLSFFGTGCAVMDAGDFQDKNPKLVLEDFFSGKGEGRGAFFSRSGGISTRFTLKTDGKWDGKVLTLKENLRYESGEEHQRTYEITKIDPNHYSIACDEVVGLGTIESFGNTLHWQYVLKENSEQAQNIAITFDDWMFLSEDGQIIDRAFASKFGFAVGEVFLTLNKP